MVSRTRLAPLCSFAHRRRHRGMIRSTIRLKVNSSLLSIVLHENGVSRKKTGTRGGHRGTRRMSGVPRPEAGETRWRARHTSRVRLCPDRPRGPWVVLSALVGTYRIRHVSWPRIACRSTGHLVLRGSFR